MHTVLQACKCGPFGCTVDPLDKNLIRSMTADVSKKNVSQINNSHKNQWKLSYSVPRVRNNPTKTIKLHLTTAIYTQNNKITQYRYIVM